MTKPKQILELEKAFGIKLKEFLDKKNSKGTEKKNSFIQNKQGEIIELNLIENNLKDISPIQNLKHLMYLYLDNNQLIDITPLKGLSQLILLSISKNQIKDITPLKELQKLSLLNIDNNQLNDLSPLIHLTQLEYLYLFKNEISDISSLKNLTKMNSLWLNDNRLTNISPLKDLNQLSTLALKNNQLTDIKPLIDLNQLEYLNIAGNPLNDSLKKIVEIEDTNELLNAIKDYYANLEIGTKPFHEAKLMILGDPDAGKTNLRNFLMGREFDDKSSSTSGVEIERWMMQKNEIEYRINIWDFGGQWQQQQVHKFFITNECIYIILLDARKDTTPELWLDWIKSYAPSGRALIVANCMDEKETYSLKQNALQEAYPFIVGFHYISLKEAKKISYNQKVIDLQSEIENQILALPNINSPYPQTYYDLKIELEDNLFVRHPYITDQLFETQMLASKVVGDKQQLLNRLEEIGTLRHFSGTYQYILNPEWLSEGVYKIITAGDTRKYKGVLNCKQFGDILLDKKTENKFSYTTQDFEYIRKMMVAFDLAYIDEQQTCFIPIHFESDIPSAIKDNDWFKQDSIYYYFQYEDYFPDTLICQFIAKNFGKVYDHYYWQEGIILQDIDSDFGLKTIAYVRSDKNKKRIEIKVSGDEKHIFFKELKKGLIDLQKGINFKYKEWIVDSVNDLPIDYKKLVTLYTKKIENYTETNENYEVVTINVKDTLGIIQKERDTNKEISTIINNTTNNINYYGDFIGRDRIGRDKNINPQFNFYGHAPEYNTILDELEKIKTKLSGKELEEVMTIIEDLSQIPSESNPQVAKGLFAKILDRAKSFGDTLKDQAEKEVAKKILWTGYLKAVEELWKINEKIDWLTIINSISKN